MYIYIYTTIIIIIIIIHPHKLPRSPARSGPIGRVPHRQRNTNNKRRAITITITKKH